MSIFDFGNCPVYDSLRAMRDKLLGILKILDSQNDFENYEYVKVILLDRLNALFDFCNYEDGYYYYGDKKDLINFYIDYINFINSYFN